MQRRITLKTAKKKQGAFSRARVRRAVAEVYATPLDQVVASIPKSFDKIILTKTNTKSLAAK